MFDPAGTILFVAAVDGEVEGFLHGQDVLITGIGTLNAAIGLTEYLATARERGVLPDRVVNLGTVGALRDGLDGVFEVSEVIKHDFDLLVESDIHRYLLPEVISIPVSGELPVQSLATGDKFVADTATRDRLAEKSGLCDMEGYAIAATCARFGVPVTLLKQVSDPANEDSIGAWADALPRAARQLYSACCELGFLPSRNPRSGA